MKIDLSYNEIIRLKVALSVLIEADKCKHYAVKRYINLLKKLDEVRF